MDGALKKYDVVWKHIGKECDIPRTDATFTEIYELIFYNKTMVRSELGVLLQLIQKKLVENIGKTSTCTGSNTSRTNKENNLAARIRPVCK